MIDISCSRSIYRALLVLAVVVLVASADTESSSNTCEQTILTTTDHCGKANVNETLLYFSCKESGYNIVCDENWKNKEQIFLQQYKPPSLPYAITEVCGLVFVDDHNTYNSTEVTMYIYSTNRSIDLTKELPYPGEMIAKQQITIYHTRVCEPSIRWWYSAILEEPVIVWDETVFVGFGFDACKSILIWRNYARPGMPYNSTPWYLRGPNETDFMLNSDVPFKEFNLDRRGTLGITTWGYKKGYTKEKLKDELKKQGWTCDPSKYDDGKCDCECGLPDPDCLDGKGYTANCVNDKGEKGVCLSGKCVYPGWDEETCELSQYHDDKECNCGCGGLPDPDCYDVSILPSCRVVGSACDRGTWQCIGGWSCNISEYKDGVCTCRDCGIPDPDCLDINNPNDCPGPEGGESTGYDYVCVDNVCKYPRNYTCPGHTYNDGRTCNCNCTVPDPDCTNVFSSIVGCPSDNLYSCDESSSCVAVGCGNGVVDRIEYEECDGGLGCTECRCVEEKGYRAKNPPSVDCEPICGDGRVRAPEECEVGYKFCNNKTCMCEEGHPYSSKIQRCSGCGNNVVEPELDEECDGGTGCDAKTCKCELWYKPFDPPSRGCQRSAALILVIIGSILVALIIATIIVLIILYFTKWRSIPKRQPQQGSDVVIMEVDEDGMFKVASQSTGPTGSSAPPPGTIVAPGTVQGLQPGAFAAAVGMEGSAPTATATGMGGTGTDAVTIQGTTTTTTTGGALPPGQQPPGYAPLQSTAGTDMNASLAETMAVSTDGGNNPALAETMMMSGMDL